MGKFFNKSLDKKDKKEGLLKRLKNIEKNQKSNNIDLSSAKSESSKKSPISDDELERSVYFPDVANMSNIDNLESKNEAEEY